MASEGVKDIQISEKSKPSLLKENFKAMLETITPVQMVFIVLCIPVCYVVPALYKEISRFHDDMSLDRPD